MMTYDFDTPLCRRGTNSLKWDVKENELPMWVADMDFATAPEIQKAVQERAAHGAYGYSIIPDEWYQAVAAWWQRRHHVTFDTNRIIFSAGVIPTLSSVVRKLTTPAENVLVLTPVYNIFYNSILNNGRQVLACPLIYENGLYSINFTDLEEKLALPQTTMMILCNPHNPIGKIWDKDTLSRIGEMAQKHHVLVVSDEIHCDLTDPDMEYFPFAGVNECCRMNSITMIAPTKTFNLAGLQTSAVVVPNEALFNKVNRALNTDEVAEPNCFAIQAAIAAFTKGEDWLNALRAYIFQSKKTVQAFFAEHLPHLTLVPSHATYLLWIDVSSLPGTAREVAAFLRAETGLFVTAGNQYGPGGEHFLRMNIACPRSTLEDGLTRLANGIKAYSV